MVDQPISAEIGILAKFLLASSGNRMIAKEMASARGVPPRVARMVEKAAVSAGHLSDGDFGEVLADWRISSGAFFGSLRTQSVFFRMLDQGFRKVPLRTRLGIVAAGATAWVAGEGKAIPISKLTLSMPTLSPVLAAAILVVTDETARHASADASNLINSELRGAIATVVDQEFFDLVMDSSTPSSASSGTTEANMRADLATLLDAVNVKGSGSLFWAMSVDVANRAALIQDGRGAMSPLGGELLNLPALVSDAIPAGTLRLINASAIAANADPIELDASNETSLQMDDAPTNASDVPTATQLTSLFQTNSTALLARVRFAAERTRDDAIAEVTGIAWA